MKTLDRKQDTRRKIQLGGLVKKAGIDEEPTTVILGILLEAKETLESNQAEKARIRWKIKGDIALTE